MIQYKYIHLLPAGGSLFSIEFVRFFNQELTLPGHLFVLYNTNEIESLSSFDKIKYETTFSASSLRLYAKKTQHIVLHGLNLSPIELIGLEDFFLRKIIWCVWGNDLYHKKPVFTLTNNSCRNFFQIIKRPFSLAYFTFTKAQWKIADRNVQKFNTIVAMFGPDGEEIKKRFGTQTRLVYSQYPVGYYLEDLKSVQPLKKKDETWIMVGHSGYAFLRHQKYLDLLYSYRQENIKIILPLSYGNPSYIERISAYATSLFGDKALIIRENMKWLDYASLMKTIDVAILDYEHQSALGNIALLLLGGAKLYLSKSGIINQGLTNDGVETFDCHDVGTIPFDVFCHQKEIEEQRMLYVRNSFDKEFIKKKWIALFE